MTDFRAIRKLTAHDQLDLHHSCTRLCSA